MTGNKSYPSDYKEIDGGFVALEEISQGDGHEFSVARTPQQNGVAERKNRTLIEAARTMLADLKLPTTFWAKAVNTACYVQNRVLVIKPHNKTPYELFLGRKHALSFIRPFGCLVTILNTLDHLGKFDGKADEGFFVGYSTNSKAFRVFNSRTRIVEKNMHVKFSKETPNIVENRPNWLFDIDALTISMNYKPVVTGNQTNGNAGTKKNIDAGQAGKKIVPDQEYILLPLLTSDPSFSKSSKDSPDARFKPSREEEKIDSEHLENKDSEVPNTKEPRVHQDIDDPSKSVIWKRLSNSDMMMYEEEVGVESSDMNNLATNLEPKKVIQALTDPSRIEAMQDELLQFKLQKVWILVDLPYGKKAIGTKWVYINKKDDRGIVVRNKARLLAQGYTQEEGIDYDEFFAPVSRIKVEKALYGLHQALKAWYETLSTYLLENGFRRETIDKTLFIKKDKDDILLVQVKQKDDGIFISQDKYVADILKKFDFATVKTASTPMETNKALLKDEEAADVDVHLYRSMIGSLIDYASASLDKKSTTGGCQFLGRRLISQKCKKQTIVANSTTKAEYVAAANCCGQGTDSGSGPRCQDTILGVRKLKFNLMLHLNKSYDPPLSRVNTVGNREDNMKLKELMEFGTKLELKIERELVRIKINDENAFWDEIGVNAGVSKLMLLSINLLLPVLVYAARHSLTAVRHNCVFGKPEESNRFDGIIDFLNASSIKYALTVNPTVYESCIQHFWETAKAKIVNGERQIQALVDKKKAIITEKSVRSGLMLEDAKGIECLPNDVIFDHLTLMGAKTTAWNEFSSTMASAIICLATN
ncbi:putative ribonuclease H-like domain-containing protein [Tanacetum coccineum]